MKAEAEKQQQDYGLKTPDQGLYPKRYPPKKLNGIPTMVEECHRMRLQIRASEGNRKIKTLLFASATEAEGTTTVAINFARTLATAGESVLLVDANLRSPSLHQAFNLEQRNGLSELFQVKKSLSDVIKKTIVANLSVITSGAPHPNPFSLFGADSIEPIVDMMKEQADWVLFDAPPVNAYNDSTSLAEKTDGVVLVVEAEKTRWEVAQKARRQLEQCGVRILGAVLNRRQMRIPGWAYRMM